jgi:hypothetical protein
MSHSLQFSSTVPDGQDGDVDVLVTAALSYSRGQAGTLSDPAGCEVEILAVEAVNPGETFPEITDETLESLERDAMDAHRGAWT